MTKSVGNIAASCFCHKLTNFSFTAYEKKTQLYVWLIFHLKTDGMSIDYKSLFVYLSTSRTY